MADESQALTEMTCPRCTPAAHDAFAVAYEAAWSAGYAVGRRAEVRDAAMPTRRRTGLPYRGRAIGD